MLKVENVGYWYDRSDDFLFKDVNVHFKRGKSYAILGSSGSGKTTFLSLLAGLDRPKEGEIYYEGQSLRKIGLTRYRRDDVSVVFQAYNLLPYMTPLQNVTSAMAITRAKHSERKAYAQQKLKNVGINDRLMNQLVTRLSGGQQQRVAIVRATCCGHDLIVADEPTGNLDEKTSGEIVALFQKMAHKEKKCVIIVTHEQEVADACDEVYELKNQAFHLIRS